MPLHSTLSWKSAHNEPDNAEKNEDSGPDRIEASRSRHTDRHCHWHRAKHGASLKDSHDSHDDVGLQEDDIKALFSGAPHFILEAGADGTTHPHVYFPWDKELEIADLLDRKMLTHESFASCTLHAHLPIPGSDHTKKRPVFGFGVFETPNMLAYQGKEPGTIGMKHFLEIPVRDSLKTETQLREENIAARALQMNQIAHMGSVEAYKAMQLGGHLSNIGQNAAWRDRDKFIRDRGSWKELGLRDINMDIINTRAAVVGPWYNEMSREGWRRTILDQVDSDTLYDELFTLLLCPPPKATKSLDRSLCVQIEALVNVLSTPGAWFDFSLVEWRFRLGEILWEVPAADQANPHVDPGAQRHWLLVQILLSIELAVRLDAVLRDQQIHLSEDLQLPGLQMYRSLRNKKTDWDIIMVRAFMDHVYVEDRPGIFPQTRPELGKRASSNVFSKWRQRLEQREGKKDKTAWDMIILPRHVDVQVEGLLKFGKAIEWPNMEAFEHRLRIKLERYIAATSVAKNSSFVHPLQRSITSPQATHDLASRSAQPLQRRTTTPLASNAKTSKITEGKERGEESGLRVTLQPASELESGGWLSRSWFNGLILPGETISHFLMSTILEQDQDITMSIGLDADLYGGFALNGQSWWSKACIVGKVMAAYDGVECMGWISTQQVQPMDQSRRVLLNRWFTVKAQTLPDLGGEARIHSKRAVSADSNLLGDGQGRAKCKDFVVARDESSPERHEDFRFEALVLRNTESGDRQVASIFFKMIAPDSAASMEMEWELTHEVHFISASACRVPSRRAVLPSEHEKDLSTHRAVGMLDGHPLHGSFRHTVKSISGLVEGVPENPSNASPTKGEVWVLDARRYSFLQVLARAWCSKVGQHAIISRLGQTCLSCSIREAKALAIGIVIRVGHRD